MAPEETRTTSPAAADRRAGRPARSPAAHQIPPDAVVNEDEPTFTTTRRAALISARWSLTGSPAPRHSGRSPAATCGGFPHTDLRRHYDADVPVPGPDRT